MLGARQVPAEGPDVPTSRTSRRPRAARPRGSRAAPAPTTCAAHAQPGLPARPPAGRARLKTDSSACSRRGGMVGCGSDHLLGRRAERGGRPRQARRSGETPLPAPGVGRCPACPPVPGPGREAGNARQARPRPCTRGRSSRPGRWAAGGSGQPSVGTGSVPWQRWCGAEPCAGRDVGVCSGCVEGASRTTEKPRSGAWKSGHCPYRKLLPPRAVRSQCAGEFQPHGRPASGRRPGPRTWCPGLPPHAAGPTGLTSPPRTLQALRPAQSGIGNFWMFLPAARPHRCPVTTGPAHTLAAL